VGKLASLRGPVKRKQHRVSKWRVRFVSKCLEKFDQEQGRLRNELSTLSLGWGAGGIEPPNGGNQSQAGLLIESTTIPG
jgi:hypothetical protein